MDSGEWVGRYIKCDVLSGHYFKGRVIKADKEFLTLEDFKGNIVTLAIHTITLIREVSQ